MPIYQGKAMETHYNGFINKQKPKFIFFVIKYFSQQPQKLTTLVKKQDDLLDVKLRLYGGSEMCEVVAAFFLGKSVESGFTVFKNVCDKQMGRKKYKIYLRVLF